MKILTYTLLCICLPFIVYTQIQAQTCKKDFSIDVEIKNSTCLSNGEIKVKLSGDTTNLFNIQYGLSSTTNGFTINPQSDNILRNIPPGKYVLTVRAFCKIDKDYEVYKDISSVVVGGNYTVPQVSFNAKVSRKSYDICNTGIIALDVTDGSGNFTFTITSAPAGIATPAVVVPTEANGVYTLPGQNYPAGNYKIQVDDGCYTAVKEFTLGTITGFPEFKYTGSYASSNFLADVDNTQGSCHYLNWKYRSIVGEILSNVEANPDYKRYCLDGMYEIGISRVGEMPTYWTTWDHSSTQMMLNSYPYKVSDFYAHNSLQFYTRLKGCENKYTSFISYIDKPYVGEKPFPACDKVTYNICLYGVACYPLSVTVKNTQTANIIYQNSNWLDGKNRTDPIVLDYNTYYDVIITDQNGTETKTYLFLENRYDFILKEIVESTCDSYSFVYEIKRIGKPIGCYDKPTKITVIDPDGQIIYQETFIGEAYPKAPRLKYKKKYTIQIEHPDGTNQTFIQKNDRGQPTKLNIQFTDSYSNQCRQRGGQMWIYAEGAYWPQGTIFTITGPEGYTPRTDTITETNSLYRFIDRMPRGIYTVTANTGCGTPLVAKANHLGFYDYENFGYDSQMTCSGLKVTPKGTMTYQGQPVSTYFSLTKGPAGYDKSVISPGGSFIFSTPGNYVLRIQYENAINTCGMEYMDIVYNASPLDFDPNATSAYVCVGETVGNIYVKAINGVAPYTYELWDKTNTVKENVGNITTDGSAHFIYGESNETYTVRITDQCGNNINQQIKVVNLSDHGIAYTPENKLCYGETIRLRSVALGQATYNWMGPNNFSSTEQNPQIANTTDLMTGWYKLTVKPEFCDNPVQDSIYIQVYTPITAGEVVSNQSVYVRAQPPVLSSQTTGGSGSYTYQWQRSEDGISGWTNIQGATNDTYQPSVLKSGIDYYRKISYNKCGTVYSDPIALTIKAWFIPVNPHIRNKGQK